MTQHTIDEHHSDAESFHSAISSVGKDRPKCRRSRTDHRSSKKDGSGLSASRTRHDQAGNDSAVSPEGETSSGSTSTASAEEGDERPSPARRSRRHQRHRHRPRQDSEPVTPPDRKSSLRTDKKPRTSRRSSRQDTATLHRQSCLLFESLDGVLALHAGSGSSVPSLSPPSTRTTTRRTSLVPVEAETGVVVDDNLSQGHRATLDEKSHVGMVLPGQMRTQSYSSRKTSVSSYGYGDSRYSESISASRSHSPYYTGVDMTPRMSVSSEQFGRLNGGGGQVDDDEERVMRATTTTTARPPLNTVISWTSDATRRNEYAKIDRAHSGVRGFWRRVVPKCLHSKDARRAFFTGDCDGDSVRRFRLDLDDADEDSDTEAEAETEIVRGGYDEKIDGRGQDNSESRRRSVDDESEQKTKTETNVLEEVDGPKNWWTCFR